MPPQWPNDWDAPIPDDIRGLIFDCDGTLVDTMPVHWDAWCTVLQNLGATPPKREFYYALAGMPTVGIAREFSKHLNLKMDCEKAAVDKEKIYVSRLANLEPIHRVIEIVKRERSNGSNRKLAVASGGEKWVVKHSLEIIGVADLFDAIVGADDCTHGKPHPEVFLKAAAALNLPPESCLVYEDAEMGFQAAKAANMRLIDVRPWYKAAK